MSHSSCARKETVGINVTSRNGDSKIMQSNTITSGPTTSQFSRFRRTSGKVIPTEKI